jgi:hypothetical protein
MIRAQEQSEGNEHPRVEPSIPQDHLEPSLGAKVNAVLARNDSLLERIDLLRKIAGHYMHKAGAGRKDQLAWGDLLKADPVTVQPDGRGGYSVRRES